MMEYLHYLICIGKKKWIAVRLYKKVDSLAYKAVHLKVDCEWAPIIYDSSCDVNESDSSKGCQTSGGKYRRINQRDMETLLREKGEGFWQEEKEIIIPKLQSDYVKERIDDISIYNWYVKEQDYVKYEDPVMLFYNGMTLLAYKETDKHVRYFKGDELDNKYKYMLKHLFDMILPKVSLISPKMLVSLKVICHEHEENPFLVKREGNYAYEYLSTMAENRRYYIAYDFERYTYEEYYYDGTLRRKTDGDVVVPNYFEEYSKEDKRFLKKQVWRQPWCQIVEAPPLKDKESAFTYVKHREKVNSLLTSFEKKTYKEELQVILCNEEAVDHAVKDETVTGTCHRCILTIMGLCYDGSYFVGRIPYKSDFLPEAWPEFLHLLQSVRISNGDFKHSMPLYNGRLYSRPAPKDHYIYLEVYIRRAKSSYFYLTADNAVNVGDEVKVPFGYNDNVVTGIVEKKAFYKKSDVPYPLEHTKSVISWKSALEHW